MLDDDSLCSAARPCCKSTACSLICDVCCETEHFCRGHRVMDQKLALERQQTTETGLRKDADTLRADKAQALELASQLQDLVDRQVRWCPPRL